MAMPSVPRPAGPPTPARTAVAAVSGVAPAALAPRGVVNRVYDTDYDPLAIRRANPIVEVASRYGVALQVSGRALVGLCPLPGHNDVRKPNFYLYPDGSPENDSFYCYRCNAGGDVIALVREVERLTYPQACERLGGSRVPVGQHTAAAAGSRVAISPGGAGGLGGARVAGVLPGTSAAAAGPRTAGRAQRRWDCLSLDEQVVMNVAGVIYQRVLWRTPHALAYLRDRGLPDRVIQGCGLGYADGHSLETFLRRRSWLRLGQRLGLLRPAGRAGAQSEDGDEDQDTSGPVREFFAGRIVVPEIRAAQTVWFIGRLLDESPLRPGQMERPKYLALDGERPVLGLERAAGRREAYLCEGVFDYLTAVAWGLPAFSPCGTHLAPERLGFLARATTVYGIFDADAAGREAAERFGEYLGGRWRPVSLPDGCDLNDLGCQNGGRLTFTRLVDEARADQSARVARDSGRITPGPLPTASPGVRQFHRKPFAPARPRGGDTLVPRAATGTHGGPSGAQRLHPQPALAGPNPYPSAAEVPAAAFRVTPAARGAGTGAPIKGVLHASRV